MKNHFFIEKTPDQQYRILLIGDIDSAVCSELPDEGLVIEHRQNMLDAISLATTESFNLIAIVFGSFNGNLKPAIKNLRSLRAEAKIILLAQMHEEPDVTKFISSSANGIPVIDDYSITPVQFSIATTQQPEVSETTEDFTKKIIDQKNRIDILEKLATEDDLTGIKNRRYVMEFLRQITNRAKKESLQVTLLSFDIDNFKEYNDLYGHPVGDSILKQVAILMQKCCRAQDVVGRIGGDEFAAIFWNLPAEKNVTFESERRNANSQHPDEVIMISERFRMELNKTDLPALGAKGKGVLTISGGLATYPHDGTTIQELFAKADNALLEAKRNGKNQVYLVGTGGQQPPQTLH